LSPSNAFPLLESIPVFPDLFFIALTASFQFLFAHSLSSSETFSSPVFNPLPSPLAFYSLNYYYLFLVFPGETNNLFPLARAPLSVSIVFPVRSSIFSPEPEPEPESEPSFSHFAVA
jgi:hypothetical protein